MVDRQWAEGSGRRAGSWVGWTLAMGLAAGWAAPQAWASGPDETILDASTLAMLEQRADQAKPQEQCYLYTEVLHGLTEAAGRAMAAGDEQQVSATMDRIDTVMHKIQRASAKNAKRLKNAEELMQHSQRRLSDMAHVATSGERTVLQSTLAQLDKLHASVLSLVFSR